MLDFYDLGVRFVTNLTLLPTLVNDMREFYKTKTVSQGRVSRYWEGEGLFLVYRLVFFVLMLHMGVAPVVGGETGCFLELHLEMTAGETTRSGNGLI